MNWQRHTKVIVKKQNVTGSDSGCGYDGVGLMSPGACHTFPSFYQGFNVDVLYRIRGLPAQGSGAAHAVGAFRLCLVLCVGFPGLSRRLVLVLFFALQSASSSICWRVFQTGEEAVFSNLNSVDQLFTK